MADNVAITAGSGTTVATEDVGGGVQHQRIAGSVAHANADIGSPVKIGGVGRSTNPSKVSDGFRVNSSFDLSGKQVTVQTIRELDVEATITLTASVAETTLLAAGAAGVFHDVYMLMLTNTSVTATEVVIRDVTAGGIARSFWVPAQSTVGISLTKPLRQATAANNWTAQCTTSVSSVKILIAATKNL